MAKSKAKKLPEIIYVQRTLEKGEDFLLAFEDGEYTDETAVGIYELKKVVEHKVEVDHKFIEKD
jgi:hypothetical protein